MNSAMADPEQSNEASEPQWVGPPWTGDSECVDLEESLWRDPRVRGDGLAKPRGGQKWLHLGSHWWSGRDEGPAVVGAWRKLAWPGLSDVDLERSGVGGGHGEQGGRALKRWETVLLGFGFCIVAVWPENWARRSCSASPGAAGGGRLLWNQVYFVDLFKIYFRNSGVEFFEFWQMHRVMLLPPPSRHGNLHPPRKKQKYSLGSPCVLSTPLAPCRWPPLSHPYGFAFSIMDSCSTQPRSRASWASLTPRNVFEIDSSRVNSSTFLIGRQNSIG